MSKSWNLWKKISHTIFHTFFFQDSLSFPSVLLEVFLVSQVLKKKKYSKHSLGQRAWTNYDTKKMYTITLKDSIYKSNQVQRLNCFIVDFFFYNQIVGNWIALSGAAKMYTLFACLPWGYEQSRRVLEWGSGEMLDFTSWLISDVLNVETKFKFQDN